MFVAALCHDIDHPGHTNAFEINISSELAIMYSDDCVLEHHHAATTFRVLRRRRCRRRGRRFERRGRSEVRL